MARACLIGITMIAVMNKEFSGRGGTRGEELYDAVDSEPGPGCPPQDEAGERGRNGGKPSCGFFAGKPSPDFSHTVDARFHDGRQNFRKFS